MGRQAQLMKWKRTKCNRLYTEIWDIRIQPKVMEPAANSVHSSMNHWMIHNILIEENILQNSLENSNSKRNAAQMR